MIECQRLIDFRSSERERITILVGSHKHVTPNGVRLSAEARVSHPVFFSALKSYVR